MNKTDITEKTLQLIREKSGQDMAINTEQSMGEFLNSITYIQFLIACEDTFNIEIEDEELDVANFDTVADVLSFLEKKVNVNE